MNPSDTIVALSSAAGPAARMIVRTAGPAAFAVLRQLSPAVDASPSSATRTELTVADLTVPAWVYAFGGPRSYTGDDLVEYHIPGSPLLARLLIEVIGAAGARPAEAGEFTARAFLNGRLDLAAAEGVSLAIAATHEGELRAARQLLAGELSRRLAAPLATLTDALALVESNLDFSEDDIAFIDSAEVRRRVDAASAELAAIEHDAAYVDRPAGERSFVLVGLPNAGKSTLLNALAGTERAIVSPVAGTTRDALSADVVLPRGVVRVTDVAGLERGGDEIGRKMQDHARRAIEQADFVIEIRDVASPDRAWLPRGADVVVCSKADLYTAGSTDKQTNCTDAEVQLGNRDSAASWGGDLNSHVERRVGSGADESIESDESRPTRSAPIVLCSAVTGTGLGDLNRVMDALAFGSPAAGATLALTARHVGALREARDALATIDTASGGEIIAQSLRRTIDALGGILGRVSPDDVLERVFATFCVGK